MFFVFFASIKTLTMPAKMSKDTNALNWFEIPVSDFDRALQFYQQIFDIEMHVAEMMDIKMATFPPDAMAGHTSGALALSKWHHPSKDGSVIYLNANPDLQIILDKVEPAGGSILMPKTLINDQIGYQSWIIDSEGNRLALHSMK